MTPTEAAIIRFHSDLATLLERNPTYAALIESWLADAGIEIACECGDEAGYLLQAGGEIRGH